MLKEAVRWMVLGPGATYLETTVVMLSRSQLQVQVILSTFSSTSTLFHLFIAT